MAGQLYDGVNDPRARFDADRWWSGRVGTARDWFCIGLDDATPVSPDYESPFRFTGTIEEVVVDVSGAPFDDVAMEWEALLRSQ